MIYAILKLRIILNKLKLKPINTTEPTKNKNAMYL